MDGRTEVEQWLLALYRANGRLTPEVVKEAARPSDSVGHRYVFNVPPDKAAEAHYTAMARDLIQSVRIEVLDSAGAPVKAMRFYVAVPGEENQYEFHPLPAIREDPAKYRAAQVEATRRLKQAQDAVENLERLAPRQADTVRASRAAKRVREARELVEVAT